MPRHSRNIERKAGGHCKIRKRGCSSSSSSSLAKNYRLKRAILVGKRAGSSTPVPIWKMTSRSPAPALQNLGENYKYKGGGDKRKEGLMSARKLAASLWEINGGNSPKGNLEEKKEGERKSMEKIGKLLDAESVKPHLLDQSRSPVCEQMDGRKLSGQRRRSSVTSQKLQLTECVAAGLNSVGNSSSIEVMSHSAAENMAGVKSGLKDVRNGLTASKELVKVLFRMLSQEGQHSSGLTLVSALRFELDRMRLQVDQLIQEHCFNHAKVNEVLKQFAAEKAAWKSKEQDRIHEAISSIAREVEVEKKLRKQTERLNKKLGRELADTRANLSKTSKELDSERRAREILEQTCDELARGIGEDRAEVEELKRESTRIRQEVENERQMLQLADVLREERVQMKLAEAKYEFEEKNTALERLRSELEDYFGNRIGIENGDESPNSNPNREFADILKKIKLRSCENGEKEHGEDEGDDGGVDSGDSELHSIELNMDDKNKIYKWSSARDGGGAAAQGDSRRASADEVFKGRKSLSEKIQWENICLQRKTSDCIEWDFAIDKLRNTNASRSASVQGSVSPLIEPSIAGGLQLSSGRF